MSNTTRILFLSANPWNTSRILVDEEAREIFTKLQEGPFRDQFLLYNHAAIQPTDVQRLLLMYRPHIIHFSGHGSKKQRLLLGGMPGRAKQIAREGLVKVLSLYRRHVRLVFLNACFTRTHARSLAEVIDYSVGSGKPIGDKEGVVFAGAFYRALGFGNSVKEAFDSATAEVAFLDMKRARGLELFIRGGLGEGDRFPYWNLGPNEYTDRPQLTAPILSDQLDMPESAGEWFSSRAGMRNLLRKSDLSHRSEFANSGQVTRGKRLVFFNYTITLTAATAGAEEQPVTRQVRAKCRPSIQSAGVREVSRKRRGTKRSRRA